MKPFSFFLCMAIFSALLLGACSKNVTATQSPVQGSVATEGISPTPIYCLYSPAQTGTVQIPHPRNYMQAAATGNYIAFFSGNPLHNPLFYGADVYNVTSNTWTSEPFDYLYEGAAAACNTRIVYGGGAPNAGFRGSDLVHMLDVNTGQWSTAHLSAARYNLAAAGYGNKILFAGGVDNAQEGIIYSRVDIYDAANNTWSTAELSVPRYALCAAAANNVIAFAGGRVSTNYKTVDFYDVATGQWSQSALSAARSGIGAIGLGNLLFFAGGDAGSGSSNVCDIYNTTTKTWAHTHMANTSGPPVVATLGTTVIFYGASNKLADVYNTCTGTWSTMKMSVANGYCTAGTAGGKLLIGRDNLVQYQSELYHVQ